MTSRELIAREPPQALCCFCGEQEGLLLSCAWPDVKIGAKRAEDARHGDVWITDQKALRGRIIEICAGSPEHPTCAGLTFWVLIPGHPKPYPYFRLLRHYFRTEVSGPCSRLCCPNCHREVSPGRVYCAQHWRRWEQVA